MQSLQLEQGEFQLLLPAGSSRYLFEGSLYYPYALLMQDDQPVNQYGFKGWYEAGLSELFLNERVQVHFGDQLKLTSQGVGYNVTELSRLMEDSTKPAGVGEGGVSAADEPKGGAEDEAVALAAAGTGNDAVQSGEKIGVADEPAGLHLLIDARDTYLWLDKDHRIVADDLQLDVVGEQATLELRHHSGNANLDLIELQKTVHKRVNVGCGRYAMGLWTNLDSDPEVAAAVHAEVPPNDGGVSLGQLVVADAVLRERGEA